MEGRERVDAILDFWFGDSRRDRTHYGEPREAWFVKDPTFDAIVCDRFLTDFEQATTGQLDAWKTEPESCLALILLLDQFPRNLFRGDARAFATDTQAVAVAQGAIASQLDQSLQRIQRWFVYLPLEHSENLTHQNQCVELFRQLGNDPNSQNVLHYAIQHRDIIARFGRFPHRNAILGRPNTPEEEAFLTQPGSSF